MQSYAEPGKWRADCKAPPSHSPSVRDLHSSFLRAGARRGTCLCNRDTNKCRLRGGLKSHCGVRGSRALWAASALLCRWSCRPNVSFWQKEGSKAKWRLRNSLNVFQSFAYPCFAQEQVYWEKDGWRVGVKQSRVTGDSLSDSQDALMRKSLIIMAIATPVSPSHWKLTPPSNSLQSCLMPL